MPVVTVDTDDLASATTVALLLGVGQSAVSNWQRRTADPLPDPIITIGGVSYWSKAAVMAWNASRRPNRQPGGARIQNEHRRIFETLLVTAIHEHGAAVSEFSGNIHGHRTTRDADTDMEDVTEEECVHCDHIEEAQLVLGEGVSR